MDRPLSSYEIQERFGRMPTRAERQAFSHWRNANPDTPLSEEDAARMAAAARAAEDRWRYAPASDRLCAKLAAHIGDDQAELVKELVKALIEEDRYDRSPDRQED